MKLDVFGYLPPEIIINILSTLPIRSIRSCKCVCKSWNALLESGEFVNSHLLKAIPGLVVHNINSKLFKFEDGLIECSLPSDGWVLGSANGLLFLCSKGIHFILYVCNPVTRDYVELPSLRESVWFSRQAVVALGFGVSKITGQHKVVMILKDRVLIPKFRMNVMVLKDYNLVPECECHVYTIGTGLWRRVAVPDTRLEFWGCTNGAFLNGNLHWPVMDIEGSQQRIYCVDLETELYSTFSLPLKESRSYVGLCVFQDTLCLCDETAETPPYEIDIWLMKEYGDEKSWTKQFSIPRIEVFGWFNPMTHLVQEFKDDEILIARRHSPRFYFKKNNIVHKLDRHEGRDHIFDDIDTFFFTPSFLSLKNFEMENVRSFSFCEDK